MARIFNSRGLILVLLTAVVGSGLGQLNAKPTAAATSCEVVYNIANDWGSGFIGDVTLKNTGSAVSSWTLGWSFAGNQSISNLWGGVVSQSGANVSVSNAGWNGNIGTGGTVNFGFQAGYSGANAKPTVFTLNGVTCGGIVLPTTTIVPTTPPTNTTIPTTPPTNTTVPTTPPTSTTGPTNVPTNTPVPSATTRPTNTTVPTTPPTSTTGPTNTPAPTTVPGVHVANPFVGAQGYINSEYAARVNAEANATGGTLGSQMRQVASYPTAVWLDRIAAIAGSSESMGLRAHLDAALVQQQTSGQQVAISIVVYDLPNRDCAALASNGELKISENGLNRYKTEYIDPIAAIVGESQYASLRIVVILEPDSLSNLVTNASIPACAEAISSGAYVQGVQYAINKLNVTSNVYIYMDIAHSGWLGWDSNFTPAIQLYTQTVRGTTKGLNGIDGFISNTANYTPLNEVFLPNSGLTLGGGNPIRSSLFYEWNPYFDETDYVLAMRNAFITAGFPSGIGMLIDTSRNGWGGTARPTMVSSSNSLEIYVNDSKLDRRPHRGGWCNQAGAGIGERPTAAPVSGIDAYVWVKPPGESDGVATAGVIDPTDPAKQFDAMCDPNAQNRYNTAYPTNALAGAPHAGRWFSSQFAMLVRNAYPPIAP